MRKDSSSCWISKRARDFFGSIVCQDAVVDESVVSACVEILNADVVHLQDRVQCLLALTVDGGE